MPALKPFLLMLSGPLAIVLGWLGFTTTEEQTAELLAAFATVFAIIATVFGPSLRAIFKFKEDAK